MICLTCRNPMQALIPNDKTKAEHYCTYCRKSIRMTEIGEADHYLALQGKE